jgi:O-antigen biosynthesis protein
MGPIAADIQGGITVRIALLSANAQAGDALGNQLAEKLSFFIERGADVRVFLESDRRLHPVVRPHCQTVSLDDFFRARPGEPRAADPWQFLSTADLVIADYSQHYTLLEVLPLLAGGRPRVVLHYHGVTPIHLWTAHNREALERGARQRGLVWCADAAMVHSHFAGRELLGPTRFPAERVGQIGHAIRVESFRGQPGACLRAELGLEQAIIALFVGRLAPNKCVPVLVKALACLCERIPAVHALIVGDDADLYESERRLCRERAAELGIADRLHFLGHVDEQRLRAAYRSADVFVMPSLHEGFCIPVIEAMASGLPVLAARAGALPETVGDAGLTFEPNDAADLARQLARVLAPRDQGGRQREAVTCLRVAVVACRYGADFAGGAERSLATLAETLHEAGHQVEVYTTTLRDLEKRERELAEGTERLGGMVVHRFRPDPFDPAVRAAVAEALEQGAGRVSPEVERDFLTHSVRSHRLAAALRAQVQQLDAIVVGPYLYGLAHDIATAFPEKTVLLPCFHEEPAARLAAFRAAYRQVGALLYHTPEEQRFAEMELGLNHPAATCVGTWMDTTVAGNARRGRETVGPGRRYLIYCGRYSPHKNLRLLFDHARRYSAERPGRFAFVFAGEGPLAIPREPWAQDLGFVADQVRRDLLAGADALVQLSCNESLSLVALEAWAHGVPLVADARCAVLAGQLGRSGGGWRVAGYQEFAAVLDGLWEDPRCGQGRGECGRAYVHEQYASRSQFLARTEAALRGLTEPLAEQMRHRGAARAQGFDQAAWRDQFATLVEEWLQGPERPLREEVEIQPRTSQRTATAGAEAALMPVRLINRGSHVLMPHGPAGVVLRCRIAPEQRGRSSFLPGQTPPNQDRTFVADMPLPGLLMPGSAVTLAVAVPVPPSAGTYRVLLDVVRPQVGTDKDGTCSLPERFQRVLPREATARLIVTAPDSRSASPVVPILEEVQATLLAAERLQRLPDDYSDVTQGRLAAWKRGIKEKLLHNFKHAYVDVLSRQQSAFNRHILSAVEELAESLAALWQQVEQKAVAREDAADSAGTDHDVPCPLSAPALEERIPS